MDPSISGERAPSKKRSSTSTKAPTTVIQSLTDDILSTVFSLLDLVGVIRCSAVCKSWSSVIDKSNLFRLLYCKHQGSSSIGRLDISACSERFLKMQLKGLAVDQHRHCLQRGSIDINQWKGLSGGVEWCRMKMGQVLIGGGDKVMRLWSAESYKCLEEYSLPDRHSLADFDFDESKVVGLLGTRICVWRRNERRNIFSSRESQSPKASSMCYIDPEAIVGCEDGRARAFDMYSRKWSRIIKIHDGPVTCLSFSDDQLLIGGSSFGRVSLSDLSTGQRVAKLMSTDSAGISTLCFNPCSHLLFGGSSAGKVTCWDLRTLRSLWDVRVSPNVIHSMQYMRDDTTTLVVGGLDGVLRFLDQSTGEVMSSCIMDERSSTLNRLNGSYGSIAKRKGRRIPEDTRLDLMPKSSRPSINCLAVGMQKVVTTNGDGYIRVWKFNK